MAHSAFGPQGGAVLGRWAPLTPSDSVRARLTAAVRLGLLQAGERLPAAEDMAAAMGVSSVTVRRALVVLAETGVLVRRPGRGGGTFVAEGPLASAAGGDRGLWGARSRILALIDARLVLEAGIVQVLLDRWDPAVGERLSTLADRMGAAREWSQFRVLDAVFHRTLAEATGSAEVLAEHARVTSELYEYYLPYPMEYLHASNEEHRALLAAIAAADRVRAHEVIRAHILVLREAMFIGLDPS